MRITLLGVTALLLAGCGNDENSAPVADAKPVSKEVRTAARQKEILGPREFAEKRGHRPSGTGATHLQPDEQ